MSAADDNHPKSVITLLQPALQKLKEEETSPDRRDTLRSIEAPNPVAGPERKE